MDGDILLARFFGLFLMLFGLGILMNLRHFKLAATEISHNHGLQVPAAILPLLVGSFMVTIHNIWIGDWTVLITVLGWVILLMGIFRCWFVQRWAKQLEKHKATAPKVAGTGMFLYGIVLLYFGFFSY